MQRDDKHNANAVPLPPDEACNADPVGARPDLEGGEGEVADPSGMCPDLEGGEGEVVIVFLTVVRTSPPPVYPV